MAVPEGPPVPPRPWPKNKPDGLKVVVLAGVIVAIALAFASVGVPLLRITVTFGAPTPCGTSCWNIVITSVSASEPLWSYTVTLNVEGTGSPVSTPLAPGRVFNSLTFTDVGMPDRLDAGDAFRFENPGNPGICTLSLWSFRASASVRWTS